MRRDGLFKEQYKAIKSKEKRYDFIIDMQCDEGATIGLLRHYNASDFKNLRRIVNRPVNTKGELYKKKSDVYNQLSRIADRTSRINELREERKLVL